jgi:hypothetical protein
MLPVSIMVDSPSRQAGTAYLIGSHASLQLYSPTSGLVYNWSTPNTTLAPTSCLASAGPYLSVPTSCLAVGRTYVFSLGVGDGFTSGLAKVKAKHIATLYAPSLLLFLVKRLIMWYGAMPGSSPRASASERRQLHHHTDQW